MSILPFLRHNLQPGPKSNDCSSRLEFVCVKDVGGCGISRSVRMWCGTDNDPNGAASGSLVMVVSHLLVERLRPRQNNYKFRRASVVAARTTQV